MIRKNIKPPQADPPPPNELCEPQPPPNGMKMGKATDLEREPQLLDELLPKDRENPPPPPNELPPPNERERKPPPMLPPDRASAGKAAPTNRTTIANTTQRRAITNTRVGRNRRIIASPEPDVEAGKPTS
jgi:hypothetical protein